MRATRTRDALDGHGEHLLGRHLQATVAHDRPGLLVRPAEGGAHGGRQAVAHGAQAARGEVAVGSPEACVASQPHLVLADVGDERGVVVGQLAQPADDVVGGEDALPPAARAVPGSGLRLRAPLGELSEVVGPVGRIDLRHSRDERPQHAADVTHDGHVHGHVLADLRGVDVDVDDAGVGRVRADRAGDAVIEAHAQGDEQVRRLDGLVDVLPAVHAHVAVGERVLLVHGADARAACA